MSKYDIELNRKTMDPLNIILDRIKPNSTVLEFGCASGRMTKYMQEQLGCKVYIVEFDKEDYQNALVFAEQGLCGDITELEWLEEFKGISFDYMIFADVLEHLAEPEKVLTATKILLKDEGEVCISVPNIAHNDILLNLYEDTFKYTNTGLLDNTHIHFWGRHSLYEFCSNSGYGVVFEDCISKQTNCTEQRNKIKEVNPSVFLQEIEKREYGEVYQYVLGLKKAEYIQRCDLQRETYIFEHNHIIERRVFFDRGEGFWGEEGIELFRDPKQNRTFCVKVEIPAKIQRVRFDPVEMLPCKIQELQILTNCGELWSIETNADVEAEEYIFRNIDPQITVSIPDSGVNWIQFSGKIEYDYRLMNPALEAEVEKLRKALEDNKQLESQICELNAKLEYEEGVSQKRDDNISYLTRIKNENEQAINEYKMRCEAEEVERQRLETTVEKYEGTIQLLQRESENVKSECQELEVEIKEFKDQISNLNIALEQAKIELAESVEKERKLLIEQKQLKHRVDFATKAANSSADELQNNLTRLHHLKTDFEITQCRLDAIEKSTFWRLTKPARKACDVLKKTLKIRKKVEAVPAVKEEYVGEYEWNYEIPSKELFPLVSVIVPNYNHAQYLCERLDSIYGQTYENIEVILLDDCSTDNSVEILKEYAEKHQENTITDFNDINGGKVFKQWNKGISHASGKYIWIAESDDYCESNFLSTLVPLMEYQSVMLAFSRSVFMQDGKPIWSTEEYLRDIPEINWEKSFMMTAHDAVNLAFARKNIVPNVSSALFRNVGQVSEEVVNIWQNIKLSGDWLFYLNLIKGGCISYTTNTTNYYRIHAASTSLKVQQSKDYYKEFEEISKYIVKNYNVSQVVFETVLKDLKEHYKAIHHVGDEDAKCVDTYYSLENINAERAHRTPGVIMAEFSMKLGGGETYPLYLANEMKRQGISVTVLDFRMEQHESKVRALLEPSVPLVEINCLDNLYSVLKHLGAEVIHSHHACVDGAIADWLNSNDIPYKHVITLHGMYETIAEDECRSLLSRVSKSCSQFIYIADKNLQPFIKYGYRDKVNLVKMPNGLPEIAVNPVRRSEMRIPEEAFVLCLVSRGIPEKGWREGIEAIEMANTQSIRPIHLVIVGDGPIKAELENSAPSFVHFTGTRSNVRDYFAMCDAGFLPSRFPGESYPLVVIESLMCGKPVIATDIAEVKNQLTDENGELAGELLSLKEWKLDIKEIADVIGRWANDSKLYYKLKSKTAGAAEKFNISKIVEGYLKLYMDNM